MNKCGKGCAIGGGAVALIHFIGGLLGDRDGYPTLKAGEAG